MHSHGGRVSVVEEDEDVGAPLVMVNDDNDNCPNSAATRRLSNDCVFRKSLKPQAGNASICDQSSLRFVKRSGAALRDDQACPSLTVFGSIVISSALLTAENSSDKCEPTTS